PFQDRREHIPVGSRARPGRGIRNPRREALVRVWRVEDRGWKAAPTGPGFAVPRGAGGAADPARLAGRGLLLPPDGHAALRLVDDVTARVERGAAVRSAHAHPHGAFADFELSYAVPADRRDDVELLPRLGQDTLALAHRDGLV